MLTRMYVLHPVVQIYKSTANLFEAIIGFRNRNELSDIDESKVLLRGCRCIEIDVWDGEPKSKMEEVEDKLRVGEKTHGFRPHIREKLSSHGPFKHFVHAKEDAGFVPNATKEDLSMPTPWKSASTATRAEPRVLHGYTLTKEVPFRDVCVAVREAAFVNRSDDQRLRSSLG